MDFPLIFQDQVRHLAGSRSDACMSAKDVASGLLSIRWICSAFASTMSHSRSNSAASVGVRLARIAVGSAGGGPLGSRNVAAGEDMTHTMAVGDVIARKLRRRLAERDRVASHFIRLRGRAFAVKFEDAMLKPPGVVR
jgi:hypothetical protein